MVSQNFKDSLVGIYRGEQVGEAIFETAIKHAENEEQLYILGSLLQLETEGKALLRPVISKLGLSVAIDPDAQPEGEAAANGIQQLAWHERFGAMAQGIERVFLPKYEALATFVTEEEDADAYKLAQFMGDHERAIMQACANVAAGKSNPIQPVVDILHFPLAEPVTA